MLYRLKELHEQQAEGKTLAKDEREELKRLRKVDKELPMEKEILKKASIGKKQKAGAKGSPNPRRPLFYARDLTI